MCKIQYVCRSSHLSPCGHCRPRLLTRNREARGRSEECLLIWRAPLPPAVHFARTKGSAGGGKQAKRLMGRWQAKLGGRWWKRGRWDWWRRNGRDWWKQLGDVDLGGRWEGEFDNRLRVLNAARKKKVKLQMFGKNDQWCLANLLFTYQQGQMSTNIWTQPGF